MHIAFIGQKGIPSKYGGIETHVEELATRLVRLGHHVTGYTRSWYTPADMDLYNGIELKSLPTIQSKHLDAITHTFIATLHACFILRPDVIHYHGVGPALLSWIPRILRPQTVVINTFHCIDREHAKWGRFAQWMLHLGEKACAKFAHEVIAVSKTLVNYIAVSYGRRAHYIPNGITPRRVATDDVLLAPFDLEPYQYIAMVSRLVPHKGQHTLIDAWKLAREKEPQLLANMKLALVGGPAFTDDYEKQLRIQSQGDASIVLTGYQRGDVLRSLFAGARFIVHPSMSEGLPIAVLEAMSFGKTVIASDIPENAEAIGDCGVLFATGDIKELSDCIIELAKDEMKTASIGHAAREHVETYYHWDDIARETHELYEKRLALRDGVLAVR